MERVRKSWRRELLAALAFHALLLVALPQARAPRERALALKASSLLPPRLSSPSAPAQQPARRTLTLLAAGWGEADRRVSDDIPGLPRGSSPEASSAVARLAPRARQPDRQAGASAEKTSRRLAKAAAREPAEAVLLERGRLAREGERGGASSQPAIPAASGVASVSAESGRPAAMPAKRADEVPVGGGFGPSLGAASLAGDGRMLRLVQRRIDHVAQLIGTSVVQRSGRTGEALVDLFVDGAGYVEDETLVRSAGDPRLDAEIETILHLGEPYPRFEGPLRVRVRFER